MQDQETMLSAEDVTLLLPWYAAGTLLQPLAHRIEAKLDRDAALKRMFAAINCERDAIVVLNENLGRPSPRVLASVLAGIHAVVAADKILD